jgi:hypothetical protein
MSDDTIHAKVKACWYELFSWPLGIPEHVLIQEVVLTSTEHDMWILVLECDT